MRISRLSPTFALCLVAACGRGAAPATPPPTLVVRDAWARPADSGAVTAAYLALVNHEGAQVMLLTAASPLAASVSLHETMQMNGMVHMMNLDAPQLLAPGDSLVLSEGGKHLMVTGLKRRLAAGDSLPIVLTFGEGRTLSVTAAVRAP